MDDLIKEIADKAGVRVEKNPCDALQRKAEAGEKLAEALEGIKKEAGDASCTDEMNIIYHHSCQALALWEDAMGDV